LPFETIITSAWIFTMSNLKQVSTTEFPTEVLKSSIPVVVDFYADWCPPCRMLGPILDRLSIEFDGRIKFVKVNSDLESGLANSYQVTGLPTLVFLKDGEVAGQLAGLPPEKELRTALIDWLASDKS
jgi:thioredoxin 1